MERQWQEGLSRLLAAALEAGKGRLAAGDEVTAPRFFELGAAYDPAPVSACRRWARALWHLDRMDRYLAQGQYRNMLEQTQAALATVGDEELDGSGLILGRLQHRLENALESAQAAEEWADVQTAVKWVEEHYHDKPTYANWVSQVQRRGQVIESKLTNLRRTLTTQALEWFERVGEADKETREQVALKAHGYVERALLISTPGDPNREELERAKAWLDSLLAELRGKDEREELRGKLKQGNVALGAGNFEAARSVCQEVQDRAEQRGYQDLAAEARLALDDMARAQEHEDEVQVKLDEARDTLQAAEGLDRHASLSATKAAQEELYEDILGRVREVLSLHRWHREALQLQQIVEDKLDRGGFRRWLALRERADKRLEPVRKAFREAKVRFQEGKVDEAEVILDQCEEPVLLETAEDYKLVRDDIRQAKEVLKVTRDAQERSGALDDTVLRSLELVAGYKLPSVYWKGISQYLEKVQDSCVTKFQELQSDNIDFSPVLHDLVWVNHLLRRIKTVAEIEESKGQALPPSYEDLEDFVARMRKLAREKQPSESKILEAVERLPLADSPQAVAGEVIKLAKQRRPLTRWEKTKDAFRLHWRRVLIGIAGLAILIPIVVLLMMTILQRCRGPEEVTPIPTNTNTPIAIVGTPTLTPTPSQTIPVVGLCGDGVCDEHERKNPELCPQDCAPTATPLPTDTPMTTPTGTPMPMGTPTPTTSPEAKLRMVGLVTDVRGIDDKSLNAAAWEGIQDAKDQWDVEGKYLECQQQEDYAKNIQQFLDGDVDLIITVGPLMGVDTAKAAIDSPDTNFAIVDYAYPDCWEEAEPGEDCGSDVELPNVLGLTFATDEAAFLAGYLAAGMSETDKVGTFGGIKASPVTTCMKGFEAGVKYYNIKHSTDVEVLGWDTAANDGQFTGNFESTDDARSLAESLMHDGADIILPMAGPAGLGAAAACQERGTMLIGVGTDWYVSAPEYKEVYLTSILNNVDVAVFDAIKGLVDGTFEGRTYVGNLANDGVGIAPFYEFEDQVPDEPKAEIKQVKKDLIAGTIIVDDVLASVTTEIYEVQPGDNLNSIAAKYGTTSDVLVELNNLASDVIHPGDKLIIPLE